MHPVQCAVLTPSCCRRPCHAAAAACTTQPRRTQDDVVCGNRAGAVSVLLDTEGRYNGIDDPSLAGECRPAVLVRSLAEFQQLLLTEWQLLPPAGLAERERQLGVRQHQAQAGL